MGAVLLFSINMKLIILTTCLVLLFATFISAKPTKFNPLCENQVNCFVNPCQVSKCEGYPDATCVADYCGGCFARWYSNGQLLNDCNAAGALSRRSISTTTTKCQQVYCFVDPCAFAKCEKHPEAVCKSNYCGGCNAWFYIRDERVSC